jgi:hypothetical protein
MLAQVRTHRSPPPPQHNNTHAQSVVEALRLLQGSEGVLPALQAAALLHHQAQAAPIEDLSRLLAQVSLCAAAQVRRLGVPAHARPHSHNTS